MWKLPRIPDRRGALQPLLPQILSGLAALAAVGAAAVQTDIQPIDGDVIFRFLSYTAGVLVIVVWWLVRRMYEDQKKRMEDIAKDAKRDCDRLDDRLDELRVSLAEIKAVCPYAPVHSGAHLSRTPPHGEHQDSHGDVTR